MTGGVGLEDVHYFSNGHFGRNPEEKMDVIFIVIDLHDFHLGIMGGKSLERCLHVGEDAVIEDLATVLGAEDEMVGAVIDAVGLLLEGLLHGEEPTRPRGREDAGSASSPS